MGDITVNPVGPMSRTLKPATEAGSAEKTDSAAFGKWLDRSIREVDRIQQEADQAATKLASGENKDIHGTMIAMQKAEITMNLMMEVRNKVISAYEEIKRMQF